MSISRKAYPGIESQTTADSTSLAAGGLVVGDVVREHHGRRIVGTVVAVAACYAAVRALGMFVLWAMIDSSDDGRYTESPRILGALWSWDSKWFTDIARDGYGIPGAIGWDGSPDIRNIAFFPGYPYVIKAFAYVPGISYISAALLASAVAGVAAAVALYFLIEHLHGAKAAMLVVVLWASQPMSIVLSMAYSEALFCAFSFAALLAAQRRHWLLAGTLGFCAGLVRIQGLATAGALVCYAAWWWWHNRESAAARQPAPADGNSDTKVRLDQGLYAVVATATSLLAAPLYIFIIGRRVGDPGAWFTQQREGWESRWDWGKTTPQQIWYELSSKSDVYPVMSAVLVLVALALLGIAMAQREWPGLIFFGLLIVAQTVGSTVYLQSKPRLLIPAVTLVVPVATALVRARPLVLALALAPIVMFGLWFGAESLTVWHYGI